MRKSAASSTSATPGRVEELLVAAGGTPPPHAVKVAELAKRQGVSLSALFDATGVGEEIPRDVVTTVDLELKYAGYFVKEREAAARLKRMADYALPSDANYDSMRTLSTESRQKLAARRPSSLAQAASIPGVNPADLQNLVLEIERSRAL